MGKVKLTDICSPKQWKTIPTEQLTEDGYPVYGANGIIGKYSEYNHANPVIAITCRGATCGNINITQEKAYVTGNAMCLDDLCSDVDLEYLFYALRHYDFSTVISGSAQPQITRQGLSKVSIQLFPFDQQKFIAKTLAKAERIISHRRTQLAKLDELVKCRFVEMFGDWHTNSRKLPQCTGRKLFVFSSGKFLSSDKRKESGIPVYGGNGIAWYTAKPLIHEPTIIIGRVGAFCGNVHSTCHPVWVTDNAIYIKQYKKEINHIFLTELMMQMDFHQYADFSGQPKITQKPLEEAKYILPAPEQQQAFATFVLRIDKLRFAE